MFRVLKPLADRHGNIHVKGDKVSKILFNERQIKRAISNRFIVDTNYRKPVKPIKGNIKLAIVTGVWKRPEIFKLFAQGIKRLRNYKGVEVVTIIAGSEGQQSRDMVESEGFGYLEMRNRPLGRKMNATTLKAKELNCTHVLCLGSDDIVSPGLFKEYIKRIKEGWDFIGLTDFYFYDTITDKALYWGGYTDFRKGQTCGAGRVISAELLEEMKWQPWEGRNNRYLDGSMQDKLNSISCSTYTLSLKDKGLYGVDIKSSDNVTPFAKWDNTKFINSDVIKREFKL